MKKFLGIFCLTLGVLGTGITQAETIKIGTLPLNHATPMYAQDAGFFKKYGLDVEVKVFQSGPALVQAVLSGDYVGGSIGAVPAMNLMGRGVPLYGLAMDGYDTHEYPAGAIMVRNDEKNIQKFSDLKGKKVGQLGMGTLTYMRFLTGLGAHSMKPADVQQVYVPFPQMGQLLASKQVDAIYTWPPYDTVISKAGQGRVLVNDTEWSPYAVVAMLYVSKSWADKNPERVIQLTKAYIDAGRWVNDNPAEARKIAAKWMKVPPEIASEMKMPYWPRNGYTLLPSIWDQYKMMVETGQIKPLVNPEKSIDEYYIQPAMKFINPAVQQLGSQPDKVTESILKKPLRYLGTDVDKYRAPWKP